MKKCWSLCWDRQNKLYRELNRELCRQSSRPSLRQSGHARSALEPADVSLTDETLFRLSATITANQTTDVYLLGLAAKNGGKRYAARRRFGYPATHESGAALRLSPYSKTPSRLFTTSTRVRKYDAVSIVLVRRPSSSILDGNRTENRGRRARTITRIHHRTYVLVH